ncbi:NAD(P)H-hydrate dehydratase [Alteribacillus bidgolensis]|uniref:Bifunctional NAD(P)H-hydrate repair enzyme n=1 Tax=Alteribacillus bidgolensis TaxID=930129 RepID=A0A1G8IS33_9BACI|nr:NAD(P)H-hydrate dehydratase [Alteribacillus bidgolensis]SDI21726.1 NAD(P)H-hydrate epimerase [Alteribacillus bidgolensis]
MQVVTGDEMRQVDRCAIEEIGMKEEVLMENAGRAAAQEVERLYTHLDQKKIAVLVGKGNNGGDGFVIARTLLEKGRDVDVWLLAEEEQWKGAALYHKHLFESCGFEGYRWKSAETLLEKNYDLFIDSMLGTGITGELRSPYKESAACLNEAAGDIISIDIPSGVPTGEEEVPKSAVQADITITLQSPKCSAYLFPARAHYGEIKVVDIGLPNAAWKSINVSRKVWTKSDVQKTLPERKVSANKGDHGKGLLVGGSLQMPGALSMSASACIYSGAGLLTTALPSSILSIVSNNVPETMFLLLPEKDGGIAGELIGKDFSFENYDAVAAGPGLGREKGTKNLVRKLISEVETPLLLDADALYYLPELAQEMKRRQEPLILSPHPGEMGRLTGLSASEVNKRRFEISRHYAQEYGCYLILKGPYTIVTTPQGGQYINQTGNEALARGGTGDILTGIALGMLLQNESISSSLCNAVYAHGLTSDLAVQQKYTSTSMASSDLIHHLPLAFRTIVSSL